MVGSVNKVTAERDDTEPELRRHLMTIGGGWLTGDLAMAAVVLWGCGHFDTHSIATVLAVREDAVCRTLAMARDGAREDSRK